MLFCLAGPLVASSVFMAFMKESPRYLVVKKQYARAKAIIKEIAQSNNREMPSNWMFEDEVKINELKEKMSKIINDIEIESTARAYNYRYIISSLYTIG